MKFTGKTRQEALERAAEGLLDILVVGGGITGAGVAREAALKGLSVLVIDKGDFASGTSSRSSKLIHGGVRYLAQGDIGLVREAARERAILHAMAPHLARPVSMMIPAGSRSGLLKVAAGLWTFDRLAGEERSQRHSRLDREATRAAEPGLKRADHLAGSVVFTEYVTNDARLTLETIKSAMASGGLAANYSELSSLDHGDSVFSASIVDRLSDSHLQVRARSVVNAAGPWMDSVRSIADPGRSSLLQLTRGIHLVVPRVRLPVEHSVVLRAVDGRSTFVVPAGDYAYIGTTDTHYEGAREEPGVSLEDADYLLSSVAATFDDAPGHSDVVGTWSGVRPLLSQAGKAPSEISRRDEIIEGPGAMVSIAGGKLTTYRRMAERVVEKVCGLLGESPRAGVDSATRSLWGGGEREQQALRAKSRRLGNAPLEDRLWATYGCAAADIVNGIAADASTGDTIEGTDNLTRAEVTHFVEREMAVSLDDVLRRRCTVGLFDAKVAIAAATEVAGELAHTLAWDGRRREKEIDAFTKRIDSELHTVRSEPERSQT